MRRRSSSAAVTSGGNDLSLFWKSSFQAPRLESRRECRCRRGECTHTVDELVIKPLGGRRGGNGEKLHQRRRERLDHRSDVVCRGVRWEPISELPALFH